MRDIFIVVSQLEEYGKGFLHQIPTVLSVQIKLNIYLMYASVRIVVPPSVESPERFVRISEKHYAGIILAATAPCSLLILADIYIRYYG